METLQIGVFVFHLCVLGTYLDFLLPKQVGQLLDSSAPEQVGQRVEVPHVELVVQGTTEAHANEIRGEEDQHNLWSHVKEQKPVNSTSIFHLTSNTLAKIWFKIKKKK